MPVENSLLTRSDNGIPSLTSLFLGPGSIDILVPLDAPDRATKPVDLVRQVCRVLGLVDHLLRRDHAAAVERPEVVIQELHTELFPSLDHRVDPESFVLADQ